MTVAPVALLLTLVGAAQFAALKGTQAAPAIVAEIAVTAEVAPTEAPQQEEQAVLPALLPRPVLPANRLPLSIAMQAEPEPTIARSISARSERAQPARNVEASPRVPVAANREVVVQPGPWPDEPADAMPQRIRAPSIEMNAPVEAVGSSVETVNGAPVRFYETASFAAGWHDNSALPGHDGNVVMAGHHNIEGKVFEHLVDLEIGDFLFLDVGKQAYPYMVVHKEILPETNVSEAQRAENGRWINPTDDERLTLITCWPPTDNTHRVVVVAYPVK
jgi:sortase A